MRNLAAALVAMAIIGCSRVTPVDVEDGKPAPRPLGFSNPAAAGAQGAPVTVTVALEGELLHAHFVVTTGAIHAPRELPHGKYPYDFDVVELFVTDANAGTPTYYEFEVGPYDQALQVNVIEPRQEYHFGVKRGFAHAAKVTATGWEADLRIPLGTLGHSGGRPAQLLGNAYAALGEGDERVYWSLFELPPGPPDFHVPSAFRGLL